MWGRLVGLESRRRRLLRAAAPGPLHDYLAVPFADRAADFRAVEFIALDLETTGLDPRRDEILSIGLVAVQGERIDLGTARHYLIAPTRPVPERSVALHRITDEAAARGKPAAEIVPQVLRRLAGRVLLGHHVETERAFLDAACRRLYGTGFLIPLADTEALIAHWMSRRNRPLAGRELRLHALRERYGLPRYAAHDALVDALATAELFCAFVAQRRLASGTPLKRFLAAQ
jgi:DNA polymerase-3 subunit epsilon